MGCGHTHHYSTWIYYMSITWFFIPYAGQNRGHFPPISVVPPNPCIFGFQMTGMGRTMNLLKPLSSFSLHALFTCTLKLSTCTLWMGCERCVICIMGQNDRDKRWEKADVVSMWPLCSKWIGSVPKDGFLPPLLLHRGWCSLSWRRSTSALYWWCDDHAVSLDENSWD